MSHLLSSLLILAQAAGEAAENGAADAPAQQPGSPFSLMLPAIMIVVMIWIFMFTGPGAQRRRDEKRLNQLLGSLKKNDQVVTIGGILGTVASIAPEKREVTIRVDDNTRLKMRISAIQGVIRGDEAEKESAASKPSS